MSGQTFGSGEHFLVNLKATDRCLAPFFIFYSKGHTSASIFVIETAQLGRHLQSVGRKNGNVTFSKKLKTSNIFRDSSLGKNQNRGALA